MTIKRTRFEIGVELTKTNVEGVGGENLTRDGELAADSSDNELKVRLDGATKTVVTEDQTQTLTNKTIDADVNTISNLEVDNLKAGVVNTSSTLAGATDSQVPSALAAKTYIETKTTGPASSTDNAIARYDGTTGRILEDSLTTLDDSGVISAADYKFTDANYSTLSAKEIIADISGTGVVSGGIVSIGTPNTTVSISDGFGYVTVNTTGSPSVKKVVWTGLTNLALNFLATNIATYLAIDVNGTLVQQVIPYTNAQSRDVIVIGTAVHSNLTIVNAVNQQQNVLISPVNQLDDLQRSLGFFNVMGNIYSPNGVNLNINKSAGVVNKIGANWDVDPKNPNVRSLASGSAITFRYRFQNGNELPDTTNIDPNIYDLAGVSTPVPSNRFTIQRFNVFSSNLTRVQLGQHLYNNLADAIAAIQTETFVTEANIAENGLLRGFLIIRGNTTDLTDSVRVFFLEAPKFGGATGVGGLSTTTLQGAYNNSATPEIITSATNGSVDIRRGSAADTDAVFRIQNGAGTDTVSISGNGVITGASIDADTNTITNIENADIKAGAAIDRTKLASGTNYRLLANSATGVMSENAALTATRIPIVDTNGQLTDSSDLTATTSALTLANTKHLEIQADTDSTTTGSNASLTAFTAGAIRLTNASLTSLANIPAGTNGQDLTIFNRTGVDVTVSDSSAAVGTAANRILTGTNSTITFSNNAALSLKYDSTTSRWQIVGGTGSGTGGSTALDTILQLTASEQLTDWSTGDSPTFLGGGTLSGTFVKETTTPLHGTASYKYTQAAGSLDDYLASAVFSVDLRFRGQQVYFSAPIQYNGNTGDIQIVIYDVTNATVLTTLSNSIIGTNGATQTVIASALLPLTCANIRVGFQVKVLNSGKVFSFDDVQVGQSLYQAAQLNNITDWTPCGLTAADFVGFGTPTNISGLLCRRDGGDLLIKGSFTSGIPTATIGSINLKFNGNPVVAAQVTGVSVAGYITRNIASNGANILTAIFTSGATSLNFSFANSNTLLPISPQNGNGVVAASDAVVISNVLRIPIQGWSAGNTAIVTPTQQISSDTLPFTFKATAIVDADPIGTFNTYTYAAGGNVATISASAPTQTALDMNTNGVRVFSRAYNATSTTASPARVDIKIGKGLKAHTVDAYAAVAKVNPLSYDYMTPSSSVEVGILVFYDEVSGVLTLNAAQLFSTATTIHHIGMARTEIYQTNAYFTFNASTTPSIAALPILQPRIATLSDVKAPSTAGGGSTGATTQTRTLNTLVDPTGIVTSLTSNQFILQRAVYYIEASAPGYSVNQHKIRLRNITDTTTALLGSSEIAASSGSASNRSIISGELTITSPKTFELQHYLQSTKATDGLGNPTNIGESEVYSIVKITRIRDL